MSMKKRNLVFQQNFLYIKHLSPTCRLKFKVYSCLSSVTFSSQNPRHHLTIFCSQWCFTSEARLAKNRTGCDFSKNSIQPHYFLEQKGQSIKCLPKVIQLNSRAWTEPAFVIQNLSAFMKLILKLSKDLLLKNCFFPLTYFYSTVHNHIPISYMMSRCYASFIFFFL